MVLELSHNLADSMSYFNMSYDVFISTGIHQYRQPMVRSKHSSHIHCSSTWVTNNSTVVIVSKNLGDFSFLTLRALNGKQTIYICTDERNIFYFNTIHPQPHLHIHLHLTQQCQKFPHAMFIIKRNGLDK